MDRTTQVASAFVDLGVGLPDIMIGKLERVRGYHRPVSEEITVPREAEAEVEYVG